jgi:hypothetical protein
MLSPALSWAFLFAAMNQNADKYDYRRGKHGETVRHDPEELFPRKSKLVEGIFDERIEGQCSDKRADKKQMVEDKPPVQDPRRGREPSHVSVQHRTGTDVQKHVVQKHHSQSPSVGDDNFHRRVYPG